MSEKSKANELALDYLQSELARTGFAKGDLAKAMNIDASALSKILGRQRQINLGELFLAQRFFKSPNDVELNLLNGLFPELDGTFRPLRLPGGRRLTDEEAADTARRLAIGLDEAALHSKSLGAPHAKERTGEPVKPSEISIYRASPGSDQFCFDIWDDIVGTKPRPSAIVAARQVAAIYMAGGSANPRYNDGELIIFDLWRSPAVGDYAIVEGRPDMLSLRSSYLGKLLDRNGSEVTIELIASRKTKTFDKNEFADVRRIIPLDELIG